MRALTFTSKWEGGFSNDKADPGGKTKYGISDAGDGTVDGLVEGKTKVEDLTLPQAMEIYYRKYWLASGCGKLELPDAVAKFDAAVNCGVRRANQWGRSDRLPLYIIINKERTAYYNRLIQQKPELNKFYKGWINRVVDLRKYCDILETELLQK